MNTSNTVRLFSCVALIACAYVSSAHGQVAAGAAVPSLIDGTTAKPGKLRAATISTEEFRLQTIKHLMEQPSPLKVGNAQLHRAGDQAATDIMKVLGGSPVSVAQIPTILDMLHKSFERPASVLSESHKRPKATLFLLQTLKNSVQDEAIRQRISQTMEEMERISAAVTK